MKFCARHNQRYLDDGFCVHCHPHVMAVSLAPKTNPSRVVGHCAYCGGAVRRGGIGGVSITMKSIDPEGVFCTLRCAARYGLAAFKGGFQRRGK